MRSDISSSRLIIIAGTATFFLHSIYRMLGQRVDWASLDEALACFLKAHPEATVA